MLMTCGQIPNKVNCCFYNAIIETNIWTLKTETGSLG